MPDRKPIRLNSTNLDRIGEYAVVPTYSRGTVSQSIVHIGVGGFYRAHQAVYLDTLLRAPSNHEWGYCGIGLLPNDAGMRDALLSQDCLYSVVERSAQGDRVRVVGSLLNHIHAPENLEAVLQKLASPDTRIVSLTITEGGYYFNKATSEFDDGHPDIVHDLERPHQPACSFGVLAEALDRRRQRNLPPFTVMSCDNLQHNGNLTRKMLLAYLWLRDPGLAEWVGEHGAFPNSMVDRITPVTTDAHRALLREKFGIEDAWPVVTEPFLQWVIEDNFPGGRPPWEDVGAQMTTNVLPYEKMKLRLLNASHQALCYIGMLLGYEFVHEAMGDTRISKFVQSMMDNEVTRLLEVPAGIDLTDYKRSLVERFSNPTICDQLERIGTEGSARIPGFVLPSIAEAVPHGGPIKLLSFTVATWFRYLSGSDDAGRPLPINDPLSDELQHRAKRGGRDASELLGMPGLYGSDLLKSHFVDEVKCATAAIYDLGAERALVAYVDS